MKPVNARSSIAVPVTVACALMFAAFVTIDVLTPQRLVVAILLNIPIALSGLTFSRRLTIGLVIAAVFTDALAGWLNARSDGSFDGISLANRSLLVASFVLVGWMTVSLSTISGHLDALRLEEARTRRERDRERVLGAVRGERSLDGALEKVIAALAQALGARAALLVSGGVERFQEPRVSFPAGLASWPLGLRLSPKLVGAGPERVIETEQATEYGLTANRALIAGLSWAGRAPLLLAILEPQAEARAILEDLIAPLGAALERVELNERLELNRLELERRSGVIRDLIYAFSHDLRTPLVANGVNMRLALDGAFGPISPEYRRSLELGMEANEDVLALADTLLLVARYESGEVRTRDELVNLGREAQSVAARLETPMRERNLKLDWRVALEVSVRGSALDLRRVIQNLLENAVKWSPEGSEIELRLERIAETVRFEVGDRGPGVSADLEPRLFTRFAGGRAGGGSGLGLYLARRIVETHGGQIGYHPRVGGGSVFWLTLPAPKPADAKNPVGNGVRA